MPSNNNLNKLEVLHIQGNDSLIEVMEIRRQVFIVGMGIPKSLEVDGLDTEADHFLAMSNELPVGTVRIRYIYNETIKLERCAVLRDFRRRGIGSLLVKSCINFATDSGITTITLNSQLDAVNFYKTFGFRSVGNTFIEAGIKHVKMVLTNKSATSQVS
tara:strand:- start:625 stop:1101 length:477 start_codon:yes stop_codon:yes gene_type:complete